ncbi:MAG: Rap1a/Tai family immunity protein [Acidobacteria bacterium]|nr:Rap1a/Tai family immunity protein [Acidobacteriota bacterium]
MGCTRAIVGAVALLALAAVPAAAQRPIPNVNDGNALARECGAAINQADGGPVDPEREEMERGSDMGQCLGLVTGVWHTHMIMVDDFGGREAFCATEQVSAGRMARIVDAYLQTHPAELDSWDTVLIMRAFVDAFPCN